MNAFLNYISGDVLCSGCWEWFPRYLIQTDHIIPVSRGGTDHPGNLQPLCASCNLLKGDRPMSYLREKLFERNYPFLAYLLRL